jgi:hypothetical protein
LSIIKEIYRQNILTNNELIYGAFYEQKNCFLGIGGLSFDICDGYGIFAKYPKKRRALGIPGF